MRKRINKTARIQGIISRAEAIARRVNRERLNNKRIHKIIINYSRFLESPKNFEKINLNKLSKKRLLELIYDRRKKAVFASELEKIVTPQRSLKTGKILPARAELRRIARAFADQAGLLERAYEKRKN